MRGPESHASKVCSCWLGFEFPITDSRNFSGHAFEAEILRLLHERGAGKTICPSEVARALAGRKRGEAGIPRSAWEPLMPLVRQAALRLEDRSEIVVTQRGQPVDFSAAKGPVRLKLGEKAKTS